MEIMLLYIGLVLILLVHHLESSSAVNITECSLGQQEIYVAVNGTNDVSCLKEGAGVVCSNLTMAFEWLAKNSCTVVWISPGTYKLERVINIKNVHDVAIIGSGRENTIIQCPGPSGGLDVSYLDGIKIKSVNFEKCGGGNVVQYEEFWFQAAMTFLLSDNVTIDSVTVHLSNGTGLLFIYVPHSIINNCTISNSIVDQSSVAVILPWNTYIYGGGIIVHISSSTLLNNSIIVGNEIKTHESIVDCDINMAGGITVIYGSILIDYCVIVNNSRGLVFRDLLGSVIKVQNTVVSNHNNSLFKLDNSISYRISFVNTNFSKALLPISNNLQMSTTLPQPNGYIIQYEDGKISFAHSNIQVNQTATDCFYSHDPFRGTCSSDSNYDCTGLCPVPYSICTGIVCNCSDNHRGRLCGMCNHGYSVAINSPYLSCVKCNMADITRGWGALIGLEFVPLTIIVSLIAILNVNLNQGSLSAYILFCQIMTISFPSVGYPSWLVTKRFWFTDYDKFNIFLFPFSIWNLDFMSVLSQHRIVEKYIEHFENENWFESVGFSICLWPSATPIGILSFWYIITLYPIILIATVYIFISLYGNGYRCIVSVFRPLHRFFARFWRTFNIQPSLTHTIASIYTLCFTQLAAISLKILHPTLYEDHVTGDTTLVYFYEGSQQYFSGWYILSSLFAIIVLCVLITFTFFLTLYPFQWVQKLMNKLPFKKDLLISITDVYTAPYKNGTAIGSWDYRYFAGTNFLLRLIIMAFYYVPQNQHTITVVPLLEVTLCSFYICLLLIFRPYKRFAHIVTEVTLFLCLAVLSCCQFYNFSLYNVDYYRYLIIPTTGLVLLMTMCYSLVWILTKLKYGYRYMFPAKKPQVYTPLLDNVTNNSTQIQRHSSITKYGGNSEDDGILYADRVLYPNQYNSSATQIQGHPSTKLGNGEARLSPIPVIIDQSRDNNDTIRLRDDTVKIDARNTKNYKTF